MCQREVQTHVVLFQYISNTLNSRIVNVMQVHIVPCCRKVVFVVCRWILSFERISVVKVSVPFRKHLRKSVWTSTGCREMKRRCLIGLRVSHHSDCHSACWWYWHCIRVASACKSLMFGAWYYPVCAQGSHTVLKKSHGLFEVFKNRFTILLSRPIELTENFSIISVFAQHK